jgi:hypothetical protein
VLALEDPQLATKRTEDIGAAVTHAAHDSHVFEALHEQQAGDISLEGLPRPAQEAPLVQKERPVAAHSPLSSTLGVKSSSA